MSAKENRDIHQTVPDHRVKLTPEGWKQAEEAGRKLRSLLHPTDTLHFFTSPYRRARETTEGILRTLTAPTPSSSSSPPAPGNVSNQSARSHHRSPVMDATTTPSPFPRSTIKVYEEPRLREQDFGNFQPSSSAMSKMWQERANYGHFFYRIPNGESAADAYDRISGFNESLWRSWADDGGEGEGASVTVLVTHGLMTRVFLMKWYHFSVEYFEDLRNVDHCEFVVMKLEGEDKGKGRGKYRLQNQLRTWSGLRRERAEREAREKYGAGGDEVAEGGGGGSPQSPIPIRKKWSGCQDGNVGEEEEERSGVGFQRRQQMRRRQNTADLFRDDDEELVEEEKAGESSDEEQQLEADLRPGVEATSLKSPRDRLRFLRAGRDGGGSNSGAGSPDESEDEKNAGLKRGGAMAMALSGKLDGSRDRARADALGDQSGAEDEEEEERDKVKGADKVEKMQWLEKSVDSSVR